MVMKVKMGPGAVWDITSSYPASAFPAMPIRYTEPNCPPVEFESILKITEKSIKSIKKHHLYLAAFEFPQDCLRPTIAIRTRDTMICPLTTAKILSDGSVEYDYYWLWGVELIQAIRLGKAVVLLK